MFQTRYPLALKDGALTLPDTGSIVVFGPAADANLSDLPKDRCVIVAPDYPVHTAWQKRGWTVSATPPEGEFAAAIVCVPRAKALAQAWIAAASAATNGGLIVVDGQKTDGIESLLKALSKKATTLGVISKAHGKIAWMTDADVQDWTATTKVLPDGNITRPGVFSADGLDKGTAALIAALPADIKGRVADLGAGWGALAPHILAHEDVKELHLVEANITALDCARENVKDGRVQFIWGDATTHVNVTPYDLIISNPPFHTGRKGDPDIGRAFIRAAAINVKVAGQFIMVANRHLPYEETLSQHFNEVAEIGGTSAFKVIRCAKPRRAKR